MKRKHPSLGIRRLDTVSSVVCESVGRRICVQMFGCLFLCVCLCMSTRESFIVLSVKCRSMFWTLIISQF